jgi:hypothetical protein
MKYANLRAFLAGSSQPRIKMSFAQVAAAAKVKLPASAFRHPQWWQNDAEHHVQAKAWIEAGYKTENVDIDGQSVEFVRVASLVRGVREMQESYDHKPGPPYKVHPAYGALKGSFTIRDWDVTKPALDADELAEWEANIERMANEMSSARSGDAGIEPDAMRHVHQVVDHAPHQDPKTVKVHPMIGALKGTFTIRGWDVTKPALDDAELVEWEANIENKFDEIAKRGAKSK